MIMGVGLEGIARRNGQGGNQHLPCATSLVQACLVVISLEHPSWHTYAKFNAIREKNGIKTLYQR